VGNDGRSALFIALVRSPSLSTALSRRRSGGAGPGASPSWRCAALAQALAGKLDAIGVVNDAVEDGVGERGISSSRAAIAPSK